MNRTTTLPAWTLFMVLALLASSVFLAGPVLGQENPRTREAASGGTPLPSASPLDPLDGEPADADPPAEDPLDGDPLDGPAAPDDVDVPTRLDRLEIARSGRPEGAPRSVVAYDDNLDTIWAPDEDAREPWLWLDLGNEQRVREVRWLADGSGAIEIAVSSDRERWTSIDEVQIESSWQSIELHEDARYVRLELLRNENGAIPEIAEVAVYGRDRGDDVAREQDASGDEKNERKRKRRANRDAKSSRAEQRADADGGRDRKSDRRRENTPSGGRTEASAEAGDTSCSGNGERCRSRAGEVRLEEDCELEGSCTIDVNVDGGTALCDATGGSRVKAGDGEGRRGGEGGRCEAEADGGVVSIGDINP